jgi:imidazole glycerol-phosphate synthase subunit HisH
MRVTMLDFGGGNLHSLAKALSTLDVAVAIVADPRAALETDLLVLPGVGAFSAAARCIAPARAEVQQALANGLPCLGICLGMQLLFETSEEGPGHGLAVLAGRVARLRSSVVPHMGWNTLDEVTDDVVATSGLTAAYYAHSFVCRPVNPEIVTAWTSTDADRFPAVVRSGNTIGVQFHPEKSSVPGLRFVAHVVSALTRETSRR